MLTNYRAFTEDFCLHMRKRHGWPKYVQLKASIKPFRGGTGIENKVYQDLRDGVAIKEEYVSDFIRMLLADKKDGCGYARQVLLEYLQPKGFRSLTDAGPEAVAAHLCHIPVDTPGTRPLPDLLRAGAKAIATVLTTALCPPGRFVSGCNTVNSREGEEEVAQCIRWMYVTLGRAIAANGPLLSEEAAIVAAGKQIKLDYKDYVVRATKWWRFNPWTIVRARADAGYHGMTTVLPVTSKAYASIVEGEKATWELTDTDFVVPCDHLIVEAAAERPGLDRGRGGTGNTAMTMCLAFQIAALARPGTAAPREKVIRCLSFGGEDLNRSRLKDSGFKPLGKNMARIEVDLWELEIRRSTVSLTGLHWALLSLFSDDLYGPPPH